MSIPLGLPRARDKTFVNTDLYPTDTETRLQAGVIAHRAILSPTQKTIHLTPSEGMLDQAATPTLVDTNTGYILTKTGGGATFTWGIPLPIGFSLVTYTVFLREATNSRIFADGRKLRYKTPSEGSETVLGTQQATPGATVGDTSIGETFSPSVLIETGERLLILISSIDAADRIYGMRAIVEPNYGLDT